MKITLQHCPKQAILQKNTFFQWILQTSDRAGSGHFASKVALIPPPIESFCTEYTFFRRILQMPFASKDPTGSGRFGSNFTVGPARSNHFAKNTHKTNGFCKIRVFFLNHFGSKFACRETRVSKSEHKWCFKSGLGDQKSEFFHRKCSKSFFKNVLPTAAGSIFSEKSWKQMVGKWKMEPEDLIWQVWCVCMCGLSHLQIDENRKCAPRLRQEALFWRRRVRCVFSFWFFVNSWKSKLCSPQPQEA